MIDTKSMTTITEAIRKATDPYGIDGDATSPMKPSASEVERRLWAQGFRVVRREDTVGYLSGSDCGDVAITAAEGGIGYWSQILVYDWKRWSPDHLNNAYIKGEVESSNINVPDDFVFYTIEYENPNDNDPPLLRTDITPELIRNGVELFLRGVPNNFVARAFDDMEEIAAMDASEADCVIQLGTFGELVFG